MGKTTKIEWAQSTQNWWIGCTRLSRACDFCYAADWAIRYKRPELWAGQLHKTKTWGDPFKWNKAAGLTGEQWRVFSSSLSDIFDNQAPIEWFTDALDVIRQTKNLTWMLLTKRPMNILKLLREAGRTANVQGRMDLAGWIEDWLDGEPPHNVWLGCTVEDMEQKEIRLRHLKAVPAVLRFLSMEPLLEEVSFDVGELDGIGWIIVGGESGPHARPMHPSWALYLRDLCKALGVAFMVKQLGTLAAKTSHFRDKKGGDWAEWPADLRVRETPHASVRS